MMQEAKRELEKKRKDERGNTSKRNINVLMVHNEAKRKNEMKDIYIYIYI